MTRVAASKVRESFSDTLNRLAARGLISRSYFDTDIEIPGSRWEMELWP